MNDFSNIARQSVRRLEKNNINNHSFNNAACLWAKPY